MHILKKIILLSSLFFFIQGNSQVRVNVNIGTPPSWGPSGYNDIRYYYLPDVEAYYDVQTSMFIYFGDGVWIQRSYLPQRYRNYDLYNGYKVVLHDYHGTRPYKNFHDHSHRYGKGYRGKPQHNIGKKPSHGHSKHPSSRGKNGSQKSNGKHGGGKHGGGKGK